MSTVQRALSLKQPWAALLVTGRKSIEIRRWVTHLTGRVLIHAARVPDERPEAWQHVPSDLAPLSRHAGGIIGSADLTGCLTYSAIEPFRHDQLLHLNDPAWFESPLYGFVFTGPEVLPFKRLPGNVRFFGVTPEQLT